MDIYVYIEGPIILRIGYFSGAVYVHPYKQQISFFHQMPCSVVSFICLLHCFHPETPFYLTCGSIMETLKVH